MGEVLRFDAMRRKVPCPICEAKVEYRKLTAIPFGKNGDTIYVCKRCAGGVNLLKVLKEGEGE